MSRRHCLLQWFLSAITFGCEDIEYCNQALHCNQSDGAAPSQSASGAGGDSTTASSERSEEGVVPGVPATSSCLQPATPPTAASTTVPTVAPPVRSSDAGISTTSGDTSTTNVHNANDGDAGQSAIAPSSAVVTTPSMDAGAGALDSSMSEEGASDEGKSELVVMDSGLSDETEGSGGGPTSDNNEVMNTPPPCANVQCDGDLVCINGECECPSGQRACGTLCVAEDGCCGDEDCAAGFSCEDAACVDVLPPQVIAYSPSDGELGVLTAAKITLTFSEPMDEASVSAALSISSLPTQNLAFAWNADSTQLTVTPSQGLAYGTGTTVAEAMARTYTVTLASAAMDANGNRLSSATTFSFDTLRRITQTLLPSSVAEYDTYTNNSDIRLCPTASGNVRVGHWSGEFSSGKYFSYFAFDASSVGDLNTFAVESAVLRANQATPSTDYYPSGSVVLDQLAYGPMDNEVLTLVVTNELGTFADSAGASVVVDITSTITSDWALGVTHELFRLGHSNAAEEKYAYFTCDNFSLTVKFLTP